MVDKILGIANTMIGKSALPNLASSKSKAKCVRISTLDQLQRSLDRDRRGRRDQQMHMLRLNPVIGFPAFPENRKPDTADAAQGPSG